MQTNVESHSYYGNSSAQLLGRFPGGPARSIDKRLDPRRAGRHRAINQMQAMKHQLIDVNGC